MSALETVFEEIRAACGGLAMKFSSRGGNRIGGVCVRMRMVRVGSALAALLAVLAGCGGTGPGTGGKPDDKSALQGRTFLSTSVKPRSLVGGTRIWVSFPEPGKITAQAGCNSLFGDLKVEGDKLLVDGMGSTDMGCDNARHEQDEWLTKFLTAKPVWVLNRDELVLTAGDSEIRLLDRKVADPDRKLAGPKWTLQSLLDRESASSVPVGVEAFLQFTDDGKVTGSTGCNALTGIAKVNGEKITFQQIATTKKACAGDAGEVEKHVLAVVDGEVKLRISADLLTLTHPGGKGLDLRAGN